MKTIKQTMWAVKVEDTNKLCADLFGVMLWFERKEATEYKRACVKNGVSAKAVKVSVTIKEAK